LDAEDTHYSSIFLGEKGKGAKYKFQSREQRELFYEAAHFIKNEHTKVEEQEISIFIGTFNVGTFSFSLVSLLLIITFLFCFSYLLFLFLLLLVRSSYYTIT